MTSTSQGMARRRMTLLMAGSMLPPTLIRQSVERIPLLTEANAKWVTLKSQPMLTGTATLVLPTMLMYCSHSVSACTKAQG